MNNDYSLAEITIKAGENRKFTSGVGWYGLLLLVDSDCIASWDGQIQRCGREDILLMQPNRQLTLQLQTPRRPAKLVWLQLSEQALIRLSDEQTDLLYSLRLVPFGCAAVHAGCQVAMLARNLAHRLGEEKHSPGFGNTILEQGILSMLLILILRACIAADLRVFKRERIPFMVDDVFIYLRENLSEELSLAQLERVFFVSHEHIAREFKKQTGQSLHRYILALRLEQSCCLLRAGHAVTHIWQTCGFSSYAYFFQVFRRELGMTPGQYKKTSPQQHS